MTGDRVIVVANRLPVTVSAGPGGVQFLPSSGGLVSGLRAWHRRSHALWCGWPGNLADIAGDQTQVDRDLRADGMVPVHLAAKQVDGYYHGFANRVLWPLFHYSIDRLPTDADGWPEYQEVNERFANEVAREYRTGDIIWVHDYHLMLLPALLRQRLPQARIGFFLHIPFPASEVFRVLPRRRQILNGLLGADLIGFHTFAYMRHFMSALLHVEGVEAQVDRVRVGDRDVHVGVFPMGVDAASFADMAADPDVRARVDRLRADAGGRRIVLGIDRLDYTKGIPRRLEAFQRLLECHPELRDAVRYIQVAVPSRDQVDEYRSFRRDLEERVGRINGACGTVHSLPMHYIRGAVSRQDLVALYAAADVMLVTPLRDGMNLVAKEFVASRIDEDGVLVLSEFAGAAAELNKAMTVNPYDVDAVAAVLHRALHAPEPERRARMRDLRRQVTRCDAQAWTRSFLDRLVQQSTTSPSRRMMRPGPSLITTLDTARSAMPLRLLLEYEGTLVPLTRSSGLSRADDELLDMLNRLAALPDVRLDIISRRPPAMLDACLGSLSASRWAERGLWHRPHPGASWMSVIDVPPGWMTRVAPILDQFTAGTPGSHVEPGTASLAWHYRDVPRDFGARQAHELRMLLGDILSNQPLEVLEGRKFIEVRLRGVSGRHVAHRVADAAGPAGTVVAIGGECMDEELFRALPTTSITVAVGRRSTAARFHLADAGAVRQTLRGLLVDAAGLGPQGLAAPLRIPA